MVSSILFILTGRFSLLSANRLAVPVDLPNSAVDDILVKLQLKLRFNGHIVSILNFTAVHKGYGGKTHGFCPVSLGIRTPPWAQTGGKY